MQRDGSVVADQSPRDRTSQRYDPTTAISPYDLTWLCGLAKLGGGMISRNWVGELRGEFESRDLSNRSGSLRKVQIFFAQLIIR